MEKYRFLVADASEGGGIYKYERKNGKTELISKLELNTPMYMAIEEDKLYVILDRYENSSKESGLVTYDIKDDRFANPSLIYSTKGEAACHLDVWRGQAYCANYISGSVIKIPDTVVIHEGKGADAIRQNKAHTHYIKRTFDGYILAVDLGIDSIITYTEDLKEVSRSKVPDGHGARHLAFSKDNRYVYCINELKATVSVFSYNSGRLSLKGTYESIPADFKGKNTAAAIRVSEDGNYLYVSNRGHNSITAFEINGEDLILKSITSCRGEGPRDFNIIGGEIICTNENSGNITIFDVNREKLTFCGEITGLKRPLCVIGTKM